MYKNLLIKYINKMNTVIKPLWIDDDEYLDFL